MEYSTFVANAVLLWAAAGCVFGQLDSLRAIISSDEYSEIAKVAPFSKFPDMAEQKIEELNAVNYPFQNTSLSFAYRVDDLVSRLTLDEVVDQLAKGGAGGDGPAPAIERLGVPPYQWNTECLRGYGMAMDATCFPSPIGLAATFDPELIQNMATAIGWEARAISQTYAAQGNHGDHTGLSCFSPVINIMRHPYWGRNQETYGEDPYLTGVFSKHYVRGLQGYNDRYAIATATCKHFDVHAGPEKDRFSFNAVVSDRDWQMTFLPAFRACLEAGAYGVMCSYNAINGVPACANKKLLTDILRGELDFKGYVVSDEGAIEHIDVYFNYTKTPMDTAIVSVEAGVNLELTYFGDANRFYLLKDAVQKGLIKEELLRDRLKPLFYTRFKLGQFDPVWMNPYSNVSLDVVQSREHRELANTVTSKSFVLLKNNGALPLQSLFNKVTIVGPFANNSQALTGDYPANFDLSFFTAPYEGVQRFTPNPVAVIKGCNGSNWDANLPKCEGYDKMVIQQSVPGSDLVIVTLGTGTAIEAESTDRTSLSLPGKQLDMLKTVVASTDETARVVVLLFNAGPLDVSYAKNSDKVDAMFACGFPAQSAGEAIYRVLSGQENPAGRLPSTWPASDSQFLAITNYTMHERTYRYSTSDPLYPFGYGLSYSTFLYRGLTIEGNGFGICATIGLSVSVTNTGHHFGEEVVQVYIKWLNSTVTTAHLQLVGFKRVPIRPEETVVVYFTITPEQRAVWTDDLTVEPGKFFVYVGGQQPGQKTSSGSDVVNSEITVTGEATPLNKCSFK